jgi:hypothetical protein
MEDDMEIEQVKSLWLESNRRVDAAMRLNTLLLRRANLSAVDTLLGRAMRGIAIELAANVAGVVLLGLFVAAHLREPRFLVPAVALDAYAIVLVVAGARHLAAIATVDFDEPVVTIATRLERLKLGRIRTTLGVLLFAPLMWVPLLVVGAEGIFGIDAYAFGAAWLGVNALFGLAVIPFAVYAAKSYGPRLSRSTWLRALADEIAGRSLAAAVRALDAIRRFEEEPT